MRAKVIIAAMLAVVVAASCRGGHVGAPGTASLPAPGQPKVAKQPLTQQDRLFNAYVDALDRYGRTHSPVGDAAVKYSKDLPSYLEQRLARFKSMPEYYEILALPLPDPEKLDSGYLGQAAKLAPDDWNVAYLLAYSQDTTAEKFSIPSYNGQWLGDLQNLTTRFPDKAFVHYEYAFIALQSGDQQAAWNELRLGNSSSDSTLPMLFPYRYILQRFQTHTPPELPPRASTIGMSAMPLRMSAFLEAKHFVSGWTTAKQSPGAPKNREMRTFACRYATAEPMHGVNAPLGDILFGILDGAAGFNDLTAVAGRVQRPRGGKRSDIGSAVRRYFEAKGELLAFPEFDMFTFAFLGNRFLSHGPSQQSPTETGWWETQDYRHAWEATKGDYLDWELCEEKLKPLLENLATFDYDNPAAFKPYGMRKPPASTKDAPVDKAPK